MNKLILALAVLAISTAPSLADWTKPHGNRSHVERSWKDDSAAKSESGYDDPYWTPCDYNTSWGPNACGGD
jgi:hypothetical protein